MEPGGVLQEDTFRTDKLSVGGLKGRFEEVRAAPKATKKLQGKVVNDV